MASVQVYGRSFAVPRVLVDELVRLRALERGVGDLERERAWARWEQEFGPLPPPPPVVWELVDDARQLGLRARMEHRADPRPDAGGQA